MMRSLFRKLSPVLICGIAFSAFAEDEGPPEPVAAIPTRTELCSALLGDQEASLDAFLKARPGFVHDTSHYAFGGLKNIPIKNQCAYGSCWAQAGLSFFEHRIFLKTGKFVELSADYIIVHKIIDDALKAIEKGTGFVTQSGQINRVSEIGSKYGFIPKSAWQPRISFGESGTIGDRLHFHVNVIVNEAGKLKKEGKYNADATKAKITDAIQSFTGVWPSQINFEGKVYSPVEFFSSDLLETKTPDGGRLTRETLDATRYRVEYLAKRIAEQLELTKEVVPISIRWEPVFFGNQQGILSMSAFHHYENSPKGREEIAKIAAAGDDEPIGSHALYIVDYEPGPNGVPKKFLAVNSWGAERGDQGYVHLYWDYFSTYVNNIFVFNNYDAAIAKEKSIERAFTKIFEHVHEDPQNSFARLNLALSDTPELSDSQLYFILENLPVRENFGENGSWRILNDAIVGNGIAKRRRFKFYGSFDVPLLYRALKCVKKVEDPVRFKASLDLILAMVKSSLTFAERDGAYQNEILSLFKFEHDRILRSLDQAPTAIAP